MAEIPDDVREQIERTRLPIAEKVEALKVISDALDVYMESPQRQHVLEGAVALVHLSVDDESGRSIELLPIDRAGEAIIQTIGMPEVQLATLMAQYGEPQLRLVLLGKEAKCSVLVPLAFYKKASVTVLAHHIGHA